MYICMCKNLTEGDIRHSVMRGEVACTGPLRERLGASTGCGSCVFLAEECLSEALAEKQQIDSSHREARARNAEHEESSARRGLSLGGPRFSYG